MKPPIVIATLLWTPNEASMDFSRMYDERWVEKLYRGVARNLRLPFRFICWSDQPREYVHPEIEQRRIRQDPPDYAACIEPYELNEPMILMGLDTVITGPIDHLADHCFGADRIAVPRDPFYPQTVCNGVALVPAGQRWVFDQHQGENDMEWIRGNREKFAVIDDLWPGEVVSFKGHAMDYGVGLAKIVYFHGQMKPHELGHLPWIEEHWR